MSHVTACVSPKNNQNGNILIAEEGMGCMVHCHLVLWACRLGLYKRHRAHSTPKTKLKAKGRKCGCIVKKGAKPAESR